MAQRWIHAALHSHWGEFGLDDHRGRMKLVTREKVLQGIAEVREGRTFLAQPAVFLCARCGLVSPSE